MQELLTTLTHAVEGASALALLAAVAWGVLSIVLSPCHLASIPLIVGFVNGQGQVSVRRAFTLSSLFALGILATIAVIGIVTSLAGRMMGGVGAWANFAVAGVLFLVGLHLLGIIPMPWSSPGQVGLRRKGALAALLLGLIFGVALGPCTFAYMAPMLAVCFKVAGSRPLFSVLLLALYGVGHCMVIVAAGTCTEGVQRYLNWNERSRGGAILRGLCGVLVIVAGLYLIYIAP